MENIKQKFTEEAILGEKLKDCMIVKSIDTQARLESSLIIPSAVQGYSLAVQYMRDWIVGKFDPGYFKTVFINGRHIMQDYMRYSSISMIKRDKPAVAITPAPDLDYDRNILDSYMGGSDMLIKKFNHEQCFFKDYDNNIFLGMGIREQQVNFNIRFRVETRAQQLDLYRNLEMRCRIGYTHKDFVSADFHIPYELMVNIAKHAGFEVDKKDNIVDIISFLKYVNSRSQMPITYKLRAVNGKREFFLRASNVYVHLNTMDKLSYDDGEREGQLDNNFNIEMSVILNMWVPSYYVYTSAKPIYKIIPCMDSNGIGLCTLRVLDIPETNEDGWSKYFTTDYELDEEEIKNNKAEIDMRGLFVNPDMRRVILEHFNMNISPSRFIDIHMYEFFDKANIDIDWLKMKMTITNLTDRHKLKFAIYLDHDYYNEYLLTMKNINETRIN